MKKWVQKTKIKKGFLFIYKKFLGLDKDNKIYSLLFYKGYNFLKNVYLMIIDYLNPNILSTNV